MSQLNLASAAQALRDLSIDVSLRGLDVAMIDNQPRRVFIRASIPAVQAVSEDPAIYLLERLSPSLRELAQQRLDLTLIGQSTDEVWHGGKQLAAPKRALKATLLPTKVNYARFGLLRSLAKTSRPRAQAELAKELGITQAAVSQNLSSMSQLVEKVSMGWRARSFDLVAKEFLENYPGPGGFEQGWFGLEAIIPQGERVVRAFPEVLLSADCAADELAPYRKARTAMVYSSNSLDLESLGFAPATPDQATLFEIVPLDKTVFPLAISFNGKPLVDPLLAAFDVRRSKGLDAYEAAEEILYEQREVWVRGDN